MIGARFLVGRTVALAAPRTESEIQFMTSLETDPARSASLPRFFSWSSVAQRVARQAQGHDPTAILIQRSTRTPVGVVSTYGYDYLGRSARLAVNVDRTEAGGTRVAALEGVAVFIGWLFDTSSIDLLIAEVAEPDWDSLAQPLLRYFDSLGVRRGAEVVDGEAIDLRIMGLSRAAASEFAGYLRSTYQDDF